jgi:hypothetical protein
VALLCTSADRFYGLCSDTRQRGRKRAVSWAEIAASTKTVMATSYGIVLPTMLEFKSVFHVCIQMLRPIFGSLIRLPHDQSPH